MKTDVQEGALRFSIEGTHEDGRGEGVFFNPTQELNRDLTVAVLRAYPGWASREPTSYLDATAATGVRGVRAADAGYDATCCDADPAATALAERNFERNELEGRALNRKAESLMHDRSFDVVDLDPFGSPMPFADAAFDATRQLLCVTATDTAPLCGAHRPAGVRTYSALPLNTEFHAEMGLRVLLSALVRAGARRDIAAQPIFSHVTSHYVRTYLHLDGGARVADRALEQLGHLDWCQNCLYRDHSVGLLARRAGDCPACGTPLQTAGPLYLSRPDDRSFLGHVDRALSEELGTHERAESLLMRIMTELDRPSHYDQHKLYRNWTEPNIGMAAFLEGLRAAGYEASRTHYGGTTLKTDATPAEMRSLFVD